MWKILCQLEANLHLPRLTAKPRKNHKRGPVKGGGTGAGGICFTICLKSGFGAPNYVLGPNKSDSS